MLPLLPPYIFLAGPVDSNRVRIDIEVVIVVRDLDTIPRDHARGAHSVQVEHGHVAGPLHAHDLRLTQTTRRVRASCSKPTISKGGRAGGKRGNNSLVL